MIGYFSDKELAELGFGSLGKNVRISKTSTIYNRGNVFIGDNVRIDNFCTLAISGDAKLEIGNHVQISAYAFINGMADVILMDYVTLAPAVRLFSTTDDYSGKTMTNATLPAEYLGSFSDRVVLEKHVIIGVASSIMPGVVLKEGTAVAGHSFVNQNSEAFTLIGGVPAKYIKPRERELLALEERLKQANGL
jgi:galactoside O-acetyltransferase